MTLGEGGPGAATACVLGGMDIVSPLGRAGIPCVVAVHGRDPARFSRHVRGVIEPLDPVAEPRAYVERLTSWARTQATPPVLYYPTDRHLLLVSRHRDELGTAFRFVVPDAELVEALVDKSAFGRLAARLDLPVPPSWYVAAGDPPPYPPSYPVIVKPAMQQNAGPFRDWKVKAVRAGGAAELRGICREAAAAGVDCMVQAYVPGPESRIESYHAFVDGAGATRGEFTGIKLRTDPPAYGQSTAVRVGRRADVLDAGRRVVAVIGLRPGVAKVDFKRDPDGRLWLLEVNPRFNLWHHPGAVAGINLPAMVHAHLTGRPHRPAPFRPGVTWCDLRGDRRAQATAGRPMRSWLRYAARAGAHSFGAWDDPMPLLRGLALPAVRRGLGRVRQERPRP